MLQSLSSFISIIILFVYSIIILIKEHQKGAPCNIVWLSDLKTRDKAELHNWVQTSSDTCRQQGPLI